VHRFRVQFSKGEAVKYISHLDLVRAFERALRRAEIPIAFSEGFNPHPKLSLASALRVGTTSEAEVLDLELSRPVEPEWLTAVLQTALPSGIAVSAVKNIEPAAPAAMAVANLARYRIEARLTDACPEAAARAALAAFLAAEVITVERETSKGKKNLNIRPLTQSLALLELSDDTLSLAADLSMGTAGTGRPEEVVAALREEFGLPLAADGYRMHRTGLYHRRADGTVLPLFEI